MAVLTHQSPFAELRALGAIELELDALVADRVGAARRAGLSWEDIAQAVGVSRSGAWKRWREVVEAPGPTRHLRRQGERLELTKEATQAVRELASMLVSRLTEGAEVAPWGSAVRTAMTRLSVPFSTQRIANGMRFYARNGTLIITCTEPSREGAGGLVATLLPPVGLAVAGQAEALTRRLAPDGLLPPSGEKLVEMAVHFIAEQLSEAKRQPLTATVPSKGGSGTGRLA